MRWARAIGGALLMLVSVLWFLQYANVIGGSSMLRQGAQGGYAVLVLGVIFLLIGLWLLRDAA